MTEPMPDQVMLSTCQCHTSCNSGVVSTVTKHRSSNTKLFSPPPPTWFSAGPLHTIWVHAQFQSHSVTLTVSATQISLRAALSNSLLGMAAAANLGRWQETACSFPARPHQAKACLRAQLALPHWELVVSTQARPGKDLVANVWLFSRFFKLQIHGPLAKTLPDLVKAAPSAWSRRGMVRSLLMSCKPASCMKPGCWSARLSQNLLP